MLFSQFAKGQSLRDIINGLRSETGNLNHLGKTTFWIKKLKWKVEY